MIFTVDTSIQAEEDLREIFESISLLSFCHRKMQQSNWNV